jgi:hypothetical protein
MKNMKVYPNPWGVHPLAVAKKNASKHGLDEFGHPARTVGWDKSVAHPMLTEYVGAHTVETRVLDVVRNGVVTREGDFDYSLRSPKGLHIKEFLGVRADDPDFCLKFASADPVEVPQTKVYIEALQSGDLLPGDGVAANLAGYQCTPDDFEALETVARWLAEPAVIAAKRASRGLTPLDWTVAEPTEKAS